MSDSDNSSSSANEKARLLEALKQLHREGVRIIDDRAGWPRVTQPLQKRPSSDPAKRRSPFMDAETSFELEDQIGTDPYNKLV